VGAFGSIDLNSKKPYYLQVKELIQTSIECGSFKPDEKLPSETELCSELRVSRTVIRQALTELEQLGLIRKRKGKGSFVSERKTVLAASLFLPDFLWDDDGEREKISIKILTRQTTPAPARVALCLNMTEGEPILQFQRMYYHANVPIILVQIYLPTRIASQLSDEDLLLSMRDLDKVPAEIRFDHADQYLEIAYALKDEAELLQIPIGMPLIKVTTISYNAANTRIGVDITLMRADRIRLRGTIFKHSGQNRRQSA